VGQRNVCAAEESVLIYRLEKLSDPDAEPPGPEPGLVGSCDEIRSIVKEEAGIIGEVFPYPSTVVQVFLQRIFQQSVFVSLIFYSLILDSKSP
jgi:hypothetical protein